MQLAKNWSTPNLKTITRIKIKNNKSKYKIKIWFKYTVGSCILLSYFFLVIIIDLFTSKNQQAFTCSKSTIVVQNLAKFNNKETTTKSMISFWYLCWLWTDFACDGASIVDYEQVNAGWESAINRNSSIKYSAEIYQYQYAKSMRKLYLRYYTAWKVSK